VPLFDYKCRGCSFTFEVVEKAKSYDARKCPECKGAAVRCFPCPAAPQFKGSGFYDTDYKNKK